MLAMLDKWVRFIRRCAGAGRSMAVVLVVASVCAASGTAAADSVPLAATIRRPVSAALSDDGHTLYVANQRTGTLTAIDTLGGISDPTDETGAARSGPGTVLGEVTVGTRLSDVVSLGEGLLVVADDGAHQLAVVAVDRGTMRVVGLARTSQHPTRMAWDESTGRLWVTSLWSRRLDALDVDRSYRRVDWVGSVDLDFPPRALAIVPGKQRVVVSDAFGGRVAVIDTQRLEVVARHELPAHNIADVGLSPDGGMMLFSQHILSEQAKTVDPDVHWGVLMSNGLRWMRTDRILAEGDDDFFSGSHLHALGQPGRAAADPSGVAIRGDGLVAVTLSGVDELSIGYERDSRLYRIAVGDRPVDVELSRDTATAYVVNQLDDSISVVSLDDRTRLADWQLGPRREETAAERGERLFYDGRLSMDGWMSCHSCHTDGHTAGLMNDNLSDGTFGAPKRILTLLGLADTAPYAWNGQTESLDDQIRKSVRVTMQGPRDLSDGEVEDLAAYLRTFGPPPSYPRLRGRTDVDLERRGRELFSQLGCVDCHQPPTYTSSPAYDVGLEDELGERMFNPPSLRGVSQRGPYLHDNRAPTLESLFSDVRHQVPDDLSDADRAALIAFLRSL